MNANKRKFSLNRHQLYLALIAVLSVFILNKRVDLVEFSVSYITFIEIGIIAIFFYNWKTFISSSRAFLDKERMTLSLIGIFVLGFVINTLLNPQSVGILIEWILLPIATAFAISVIVLSSQKSEKESGGIKSANSVLVFIFSITTTVVATTSYSLLMGDVTYDGRASGFWPSPNHLALFLAPFVVYIGTWSLLSNKTHERAITALVGASGFLVLACTQSFGAVLATSVCLLTVIGLKFLKSDRSSLKNSGYLAALVALLLLVAITITDMKLQNAYQNIDRSPASSRLMIWQSAFSLLQNAPILGISPGSFQEAYLDHQKYVEPYLEWAVPHPHSLYLATWLYGGFVSFVSLVVLILHVLTRFFRASIDYRKFEKIEVALILAVISVFLQGLFDTSVYRSDLALVFWTLLLIYISTSLKNNR